MDFNSVMQFMDLVTNPDRYQEALKGLEDRYVQLKAAEDKAEALGGLEKVQALAKRTLEDTNKLKQDTEDRVAAMLATAKEQAALITEQALVDRDEAKRLNAEVKDLKTQIKAQLKELEQMRKEADIRFQNIQEMELDVQKRNEEVRTKLARLQSAMAG